MKDRVFAWIRQYQMIQSGDRIVAGVSGGADSVCLFYILLEYQKEVSFDLAVVHVNHGLRGAEALRDEKFVEQLCRKENVPYYAYHYEVDALAREQHLSTEEAGRNVRYEAFADCMQSTNGNKIALAHHQDDQAETVLYHLFRGSGLTGLCGMHPVRNQMIRPLLCISRAEIEQYLQERDISYVTDSSNVSSCYVRNRIRHDFIPMAQSQVNEQAAAHIANAAMDIQEAELYLQEQAQALCKRYAEEVEDGFVLQLELFREKTILVYYALRSCLSSLCGLKDITREHLHAIVMLAEKAVGKEVRLPRHVRCMRGYQEIYLYKGEGSHCRQDMDLADLQVMTRVFPYHEGQIPEKKYTKWFDYDTIKDKFVVRTRQAGDYLTVNAAGGKKKLKDYLIDQKVPKQIRDTVPVVADGSHIMWVVGYRISEAYKVTDKTKRILEMRIEGGTIYE